MDLAKLTDPVFYDELENNKRHAKFLVNQIKELKQKIHQAQKMTKSRKKGEKNLSEESEAVLKLQAEMLDIVKDLDETTKRIQVLIGLPNTERDQIEVNKLEVNRLGTNPVLPVKGYGILKKVPKIMVVGGHTVAISDQGDGHKGGSEETAVNSRGLEEETTSSSTSSDYDSDGGSDSQGLYSRYKRHKGRRNSEISNDTTDGSQDDHRNSSYIRSLMEEELSNMLKKIEKSLIRQKSPEDSKVKHMKLEKDKKMLKTKKEELKSLLSENAVIREALERLISKEQIGMQDFIQNGPQTEDEMNTFIQALEKQKNKMERLAENARNEIRQQKRINGLISVGREIPEYESENQDRIFDLDTEQGLTREALHYKDAKLLHEKKNEQLENLEKEIEGMKYKNEKMKYDLEKFNETVNMLHEVIDERIETQDLKTDLETVEEELNIKREDIEKTNKDEGKLRELLEVQESDINEDRAAFLLVEEQFQQEQLLAVQKEEEKNRIVKLFQDDIECFQRDMEKKCAYYRSLPFVLSTYEAQCALVEASQNTIIQDSTLLYQEHEFYREKAEILERLKEEEKAKTASDEEKVNKVATLRDFYNSKCLKTNRLRLEGQNLQHALVKARKRVEDKVADIECVRYSTSNLKEDYVVSRVFMKKDHETKTQELLEKLNHLEKKLVTQRGLIKTVECLPD
ncbi:hypothetical protein WDU94_004190 [Cyamophila willieti]